MLEHIHHTTNNAEGRASIRHKQAFWILVAVTLAGLLYLSTFQIHINGSGSPYATDVGEIQNALPRWGLIHHTSYPQYSVIGSLFVTLLWPLGIAPAAGASLFSVIWGMVTVGLLVVLAMDLDVPGPFAVLGALAAAVSTSIWIDASLAEVHTMTLAMTVATLLFALRFGRSGRREDLLWLAFIFSQGIFHQRSIALLAPAVFVLIWPHFLDIFHMGRRTLLMVSGVVLLAPLTYLYLPLRVWSGADWVFGSPSTWEGFWKLFFDNRAERVFDLNIDWGPRLRTTGKILANDMFWPLLAGIGLSMILAWVWRRSQVIASIAALALLAYLFVWSWHTRPLVTDITRDRSSEAIVEMMRFVKPTDDGQITTVVVPWGADYWALTYAQKFRDLLPNLNLVDHNADPREIVARGDYLLVPDETFIIFPLAYYEERLGPLYLAAAAPGVTEISPEPIVTVDNMSADPAIREVDFDLSNGVKIRAVNTDWVDTDKILLTVNWQTQGTADNDYHVGVHLVAEDPPLDEMDILGQDDRVAPVNNSYPVSLWRPEEIVRDRYLVAVPKGSSPASIRVGMYRSDPEAGFVNTPWLSIPFPSLEQGQ